jgi:hypothetical protein
VVVVAQAVEVPELAVREAVAATVEVMVVRWESGMGQA